MRGVKKLWVSNTEDTEKANHRGHSAAEPQPNTCGGIKNLRARKRIYGLVVQRTRRTRRKANHGGHRGHGENKP